MGNYLFVAAFNYHTSPNFLRIIYKGDEGFREYYWRGIDLLGLIGSLFMRHEQGFTLAELLVVFALVGLLSVIAVPNFAEMKGQLSASEEIRILTKRLAFVRAEAMRLRCNIRVQFSESGYSIDIYDDGSTEFTHEFLPQTNWSGSIPSGILFNGKGLVRGIGTQLNLSISSRGSTLGLSINQNGYVDV